MFVTDALALGVVPRWVIVRTLRTQTVAEHSYNVATIVVELLRRYPHLTVRQQGDNSLLQPIIREWNTLHHALYHDIDECVTGDIPRHAKRLLLLSQRDIADMVPDQPAIPVTLTEVRLVKLADSMEAATYIRMNGVGHHAEEVASRLRLDVKEQAESMRELLIEPEHVTQLYNDIIYEAGRASATGSRA